MRCERDGFRADGGIRTRDLTDHDARAALLYPAETYIGVQPARTVTHPAAPGGRAQGGGDGT